MKISDAIRKNNTIVKYLEVNPVKALEKFRLVTNQLRRGCVERPVEINGEIDESEDLIILERDEELNQSQYYKFDEGMSAFSEPLPIPNAAVNDKTYVLAVISFNQGCALSRLLQFESSNSHFEDTHCFLSSRRFSSSGRADRQLDSVRVHLNEGHNHFHRKKYDLALDSYWDAVNQIKREGRPTDIRTATAFNCIGVVKFSSITNRDDDLKVNKDISGILAVLNDALSIFVKLEQHKNAKDKLERDLYVATIINNIGRVRYCLEDYKSALPFFEKAFTMRRSCYGDEHLDVCISLLNMGFCQHKLGDVDAAIISYRSYVDIMLTDGFQEDQSLRDFSDLVSLIADMFHEDDDLSAAIAFYEIALKTAMRLHCANLIISDILNKLGNVFYELGEFTSALRVYSQGLEVESEILAPNHINFAVTLSNIAMIHEEQDKPELSLARYNEALDIFLSNQGYELHSAKTLSAIGLIQARSTDTIESASASLRQAIQFRTKVTGWYDTDNSSNLYCLGEISLKLKQFELAFWCFEKCLDILRIVEAPHCDIALVINNLCDLLIEQFDDSCRALKHYEEILERECSSENSDVSTLLETLERVGKVHELQNNPEKAMKFFI